jgi:hypothetical protein
MKDCHHRVTWRECKGFITHEGVVVAVVCSVISAIVLSIGKRLESTMVSGIGVALLLIAGIALIFDILMTVTRRRRRLSKKGREDGSNRNG